jgi:hypothetical protein
MPELLKYPSCRLAACCLTLPAPTFLVTASRQSFLTYLAAHYAGPGKIFVGVEENWKLPRKRLTLSSLRHACSLLDFRELPPVIAPLSTVGQRAGSEAQG